MTTTMNTKESAFCNTLREIMEERNISSTELAKVLEVSPQYISDVLKGRRYPFKIDAVMKMCQVYNLDRIPLLTARAWTLSRIELPYFCTYKEVEDIIRHFVQGGEKGGKRGGNVKRERE